MRDEGLLDDEALAELSTGGVVLGFGVSQSPGTVRDVLDFFDRTGLAPEPLLLPWRVQCWRAQVDQSELSRSLLPTDDAVDIRL